MVKARWGQRASPDATQTNTSDFVVNELGRSTRDRILCVESSMEYPRRLHHNTPGWVKSGALFHIRVRIAPNQNCPLVDSRLAVDLLTAAKRYHDCDRWWCELFLLMPDHWHAMLAFPDDPGMSLALRDWKRGTTRFQKVKWQDNFFDHRIRHQHEADEKWHYIRRNPVVKGLCAAEEDWPWWWSGVENSGGAH